MKIKISLIALLLFAIPTTKAQVLFEEDFDSYPAGDLISDPTSTIPDKGGWYCGSSNPVVANAVVTPETGKGNVLIITPNSAAPGGGLISFRQAQGVIDALWNNRTAGNNILKFEFEFSANGNFTLSGTTIAKGNNHPNNGSIIAMGPQSNVTYNRIIGTFLTTDPIIYHTLNLQNFNTTGFPYNTWIKLEPFVDFNTNDVYFYLPTYNIQAAGSFSHNRTPMGISFSSSVVAPSAVVKLDNIKLSALQTLPSHLVSVNKFVSSKFTVFPNPVTD